MSERSPAATWLLLRGLTRETRHWGAFPGMLAEHMPDARVMAIDLPGNGSLHAQRSPATVSGMAGYCRGELARLGHDGPVNIIAMSLGAMVATEWAARYPQEVARCVLVNTSMRPFSAFHHRLRPHNYAALLRLAICGGTPAAWEETILRITSRKADAHAGILQAWIRYRETCPVSRGNALRQLAAAARYRAPASKPAAQMLVLTSRRDALVDTRCSRALSTAWHLPMVEHASAGHDIPLDDPAWVAHQTSAWVRAGSAP